MTGHSRNTVKRYLRGFWMGVRLAKPISQNVGDDDVVGESEKNENEQYPRP